MAYIDAVFFFERQIVEDFFDFFAEGGTFTSIEIQFFIERFVAHEAKTPSVFPFDANGFDLAFAKAMSFYVVD